MTNKITLVGSLGGQSEEHSTLTTLLYGSRSTVRVVCIDGALWLAAADVAQVLGFSGGLPVVDAICGSGARYFPSRTASDCFRIIDGADVAQMIGKAPCGTFLARQFATWVFREAQPAMLRMRTRRNVPAANDEPVPPARVDAQRTPVPSGCLMPITAIGASSGPLTMSSREIAILTGKEHRNVMADIRKMLAELIGDGGVLKFQHTQANEQNGQSYPVYLLPKRETLILVSGYSIELRARIIDRWQELEKASAAPPRMLTEAERLMLQAQAMLKLERENVELRDAQERLRVVTAQQAEQLDCIADDVKLIADSKVHDAPPAGTESITHIQRRMREKYGLGADVVSWIIREGGGYRLPVVGQVRRTSDDERAPATYQVYQVRSATQAVERFLRESKAVPGSASEFMHGAYPRRFRLRQGEHLRMVK